MENKSFFSNTVKIHFCSWATNFLSLKIHPLLSLLLKVRGKNFLDLRIQVNFNQFFSTNILTDIYQSTRKCIHPDLKYVTDH